MSGNAANTNARWLAAALFAGSRQGTTIAVVAIVWILSNLVASSIYEAATHRTWDTPRTVIVSLFVGLLLVLGVQIKKLSTSHLHVRVDESPPAASVLLLFLSPKRIGLDHVKGDLLDPTVPESFGASPWRMPAEAISYHRRLGALKVVHVFTSSGKGGTHAEFDDFKSTIERLLPPGPKVYIDAAPPFDFESPADVIKAVEAAYASFQQQGYRPAEIMLDLTGGQKTTSIAGAAVSLDPLRRFQYVSTRDFRIRSFDLQYEKDAPR